MIACIHTVNVLMIEREYKTAGQFTVDKLPANRERKEIYTERRFFVDYFRILPIFELKITKFRKKPTKFMKKEQFTISEMLAICLTFCVCFCSLFWLFFFFCSMLYPSMYIAHAMNENHCVSAVLFVFCLDLVLSFRFGSRANLVHMYGYAATSNGCGVWFSEKKHISKLISMDSIPSTYPFFF